MNTNDDHRSGSDGPADLYARLNVNPDAPTEVIAAAYKALMRSTHPDHATGDDDRERRETASKALGEAHATLTDPVRRRRYDDERDRAHRITEAARDDTSSHDPGRNDPGHHRAGHHDSRQQGNGTSFVPHPAPGPATRRRAAAAYRANNREPSPSGHDVDGLREYDSLSIRLRYALWRSARVDPQWHEVRTALLARRPRRMRVPLAWFGAKGEPLQPVSPLVRWHAGVGAAIGAIGAAFTAWWYAAAPVYDAYLPAIAQRLPEIELGTAAVAVATAAAFSGLWTAVFWPSIRRFRHGRRRFAARSAVAFAAVLAAPAIALALLLIAAGATLVAAFAPGNGPSTRRRSPRY